LNNSYQLDFGLNLIFGARVKPAAIDLTAIVSWEVPDAYGGKELEVISKPQIRFKGKAQTDRESAAYMSM
jgi:hypothetical protein